VIGVEEGREEIRCQKGENKMWERGERSVVMYLVD